MVGYDKEKETNILKSGIAGVFGGQITRALVCPIDVVKIRFQILYSQLQPGTVRSELKYNGLIQAVKTIWKEESIYGFYKGHVPAQLLSMVYGGVQQYRTVTSAIKGMYVGEGLSSFFKGLTPALSQIIPYSGFTFCFNSLLQGLWRECSFNEGPVSHTICGGGAGLMSKCIVYPMDVVKKRLQVQGFSEATISEVVTYNGFRDCISTIKKQEGVRGFYKGLHVAAIKSTCTSALIFLTYECISDFISLVHKHYNRTHAQR
uniref:Mitochondrial carrier protein n=1 Tax=Ciona intestinalis TaxID=7719 RepID=F6XDJ9_CIOIN